MKILSYLKQVKTEGKKINWPTRRDTIKYSLLVVGISLIVALFLGGLDLVFKEILKLLVNA